MIDNSVLIAVLVILSLNYILKKYVDVTKDVPDLYLTEQSLIDSTRLPNQSAIYKSNKLDFGDGLRVGLDIRYENYKLRHGNFCDIWKIMVSGLKNGCKKTITLNGNEMSMSRLNFEVKWVCELLEAHSVKEVVMGYEEFMGSEQSMALVFGCLVNGTVITFDERKKRDREEKEGEDKEGKEGEGQKGGQEDGKVTSSSLLGPLNSIPAGESDSYDYTYTFSKDKGVRLRVINTIGKLVKKTEYLPVNFVSSIASTSRHLPIDEMISDKDTILVVNSRPQTNLVNTLGKILTGFVSQSNIIITNSTKWDEITASDPSIIYINETDLDETFIDQLKTKLSPFGHLSYKASLNFLSRGKFSTFGKSNNLRLLYINKNLGSRAVLTQPSHLNQLRALLKCHVIVESGYDNIIGGIIVNDFYDYRVMESGMSKGLISSGCVYQSIEIKLVDLDERGFGNVVIRGYNIGKASVMVEGEGRGNRDGDGFMRLGVRGKWGSDGCLYVY